MELVKFKTAKLARGKGFNVPCFASCAFNGEDLENPFDSRTYAIDGDDVIEMHSYNSTASKRIDMPVQSVLQKWLREKHGIHIYIHPLFVIVSGKSVVHYEGYSENAGESISGHEDENSYEELMEKLLFDSLNYIKS